MGAKNKTKYSGIQIGEAYGDWVVVGNVFMDRYAKVPCRCKCGKESNVDAYTLTVGRSRSCITCFNSDNGGSNNSSWKGYEEIPASWITRFRNYAKKKGNVFEIQPEDIWELFEKQNKKCALSGVEISFVNQKDYRAASYTASIDRVDSSKGYTKSNIQLVHKDINTMKNAFNQAYFIEFCRAVANRSAKD